MKVPGIVLSNGHKLVYVASAGALGVDGRGYPWDQPLRLAGLLDERLFTKVMKTVTLPPRAGNFRWWNPLRCIAFLPNGVVNAFNLTNVGCEKACRDLKRHVTREMALIGSIFGSEEELVVMSDMMNGIELVGLEYDPSCPNTGEDLGDREAVVRGAEAVKAYSRHPVGVKLSAAHDVAWVVPRLIGLGIEWIAINSVPYAQVYSDKVSPLAQFGGGGVSGQAAQSHTWGLVTRLVTLANIPVIGPSVWNYEDIDRLIGLGASAIGIGALFMPHPYRPLNPLRPTAFIRRHRQEND